MAPLVWERRVPAQGIVSRSQSSELPTFRRTWPANALALGSRRSQATANPVADQLPLELCNAGEDANDEPTVGRAGINALMDRDEVDP